MRVILVIDMLEDYLHKAPLSSRRQGLVRAINTLTRHSRASGDPIVWVRQEFLDDLSDAFPVMRERGIRVTIAGTPGCRILPDLERAEGDHEIVKKRYSAFFGTGLDALLQDLGAAEVVITGVNTHACVRMTAIDAYQRDLKVTIPLECVASHDQEHHDVTLRYLADHIARVARLEDVLSGRER